MVTSSDSLYNILLILCEHGWTPPWGSGQGDEIQYLRASSRGCTLFLVRPRLRYVGLCFLQPPSPRSLPNPEPDTDLLVFGLRARAGRPILGVGVVLQVCGALLAVAPFVGLDFRTP